MRKRIISTILALVMCISMFVMPASAATFTDVKSTSWYYNAVTYCYDNGYMVGTSSTKFEPTSTLTRAMFVTILYRMSEDNGNYTGVSSGFSDVKSSTWYSDAVAWAVDKGITAGTSSTTFSPNKAVTREQMAAFVYRYLTTYGIDLEESDDAVSSFTDASSVSSWAKTSVDYMRVTGIINGYNGAYRPKDTATRAEAATIFWKLDVAINSACKHEYTAVVTAATCTAQGYTTYTCDLCGKSYVDDYTNATGHSYGSYVTTTAATCTTAGVKTKTCSVCGDTYSATIAATGHTYTASSTDATCTTPGTVTYTCTDCGDTYTETGAYADHAYTAVVTDPTCTTRGYTTYTCSVCGDSYVGDYTSATGHSYGSYVTTTPATCSTTGVKTKTCSVCGDTYSTTIAATGNHSYTSEVAAPTCTEEGYTTYTCSVCGDSYVGNYTSPVGHTYNDGEVTTKPTTTSTGIMTYTCTDCGATYDEEYVLPTYTVTYANHEYYQKTGLYDSTVISTEVVVAETSASELTPPTETTSASGTTLILEGWYTDPACTDDSKFDFSENTEITSDLTLYCHMWRYTTTAITAYRYTCLYCGQFFDNVNDCTNHCTFFCASGGTAYSYKRVQIGIQYARTCWGCGEEEVIEEDYEWHVLYLAECFTCGERYYTLDELKAHWAESEDCLCGVYVIRPRVGFGDDVTLLSDDILSDEGEHVSGLYDCVTCGCLFLTYDEFAAHCEKTGCKVTIYNRGGITLHYCDTDE